MRVHIIANQRFSNIVKSLVQKIIFFHGRIRGLACSFFSTSSCKKLFFVVDQLLETS